MSRLGLDGSCVGESISGMGKCWCVVGGIGGPGSRWRDVPKFSLEM